MNYLDHILSKAYFSPPSRLILDAFSKIGVDIQPFYLFQEGLSHQPFVQMKEGINEYWFGCLQEKDMDEIADIKWRNVTNKDLKLRLYKGNKCYAAKYQGELVAFTWYNIQECDYKGCRFLLKENEAYLFGMFTFHRFRGKGIAPYIRYGMYRELARLGRRNLYSISNRFNKSAINFKRKLRAEIVGSGIFVELFKMWRFNLKKVNISNIRRRFD